MRRIHERCAGLDVHKRTVVACALTPEGRETRTFGTMTEDLLGLADWLEGKQCRVVGIESTGVYWKPVFNLLEGMGFEVSLLNAEQVKAVPGRKTDVRDAEWIAELMQHGLVRASFVPGRSQRELRELTRYRRSLLEERTREINRLQKVLEGCNIKLSSVASNVVGASGRAILQGLIEGTQTPADLAELARGRLRSKREELVRALNGLMGEHQRFLLAEQLGHLEELEARIERLSREIAERLAPFIRQLEALDTIPGVGQRIAEDWLAESGADLSTFPTHRHLASWAKLCPGNYRSAGKSRGGRTGKGNRWLRSSLVEAARAISHTKNNDLVAQYHRLARRIGGAEATVAVAHSILVIGYHLLRDGTTYRDLGPVRRDEHARRAAIRSARKRLEQLGFEVYLKEKPAA